MGSCICGHAPEEHGDSGACEGTVTYKGKDEECACAMFEENPDGE